MSLTVRMLVLLPLVAAGIDLTQATAACGTHAQTCLEAAGRGWLGPVAVLLVVAYAAAAGVLLTRVARASRPQTPANEPQGGKRPGFARLWTASTAVLLAVCTGQDVIARTVGDHASLGGTPWLVPVLCLFAGALLALVLRVAAHAADLLADGRLRAPRLAPPALPAALLGRPRTQQLVARITGTTRGRAPPAA